MSHGKIIRLDTPDKIKHDFGVGYNIYCEVKHEEEDKIDAEELKSHFENIKNIFEEKEDFRGVKVSDTNQKKLIIQCPYSNVHKIADKIT